MIDAYNLFCLSLNNVVKDHPPQKNTSLGIISPLAHINS